MKSIERIFHASFDIFGALKTASDFRGHAVQSKQCNSIYTESTAIRVRKGGNAEQCTSGCSSLLSRTLRW